jgi:predicted amidophosphoribosyltransferase
VVRRDVSCPVCQADLPLAGDERAGDEVFCTYCGAPCRMKGTPESDDLDVEEDF